MEYIATIERIRSNCSTLFPDFLDACLLAIAENKAIRKYSQTLRAITHLPATKTGYLMVRIFQNYCAAFFRAAREVWQAIPYAYLSCVTTDLYRTLHVEVVQCSILFAFSGPAET